MALISSIKTSFTGDIQFANLFFKQIKSNDFDALCDELLAWLFENQDAGIWSMFVAGPAEASKNWNKSWIKAAGEINWSVYWYPVNDSQKMVSGYVSCVHHLSIKTINGTQFTSKILDSKTLRYALVYGNENNKRFFNDPKQIKQSAAIMQQGLLFAGLNASAVKKTALLTIENPAPYKTLQNESGIEDTANKLVLSFDPKLSAREQLCLTAIETKSTQTIIQNFVSIDNHQETNLTFIDSGREKNLWLTANIGVTHLPVDSAMEIIDKHLSKHHMNWIHCSKGILFCTNTKILDGVKDYLKTKQIPRSALLLLPAEMQSEQPAIIFDGEFSLTLSH